MIFLVGCEVIPSRSQDPTPARSRGSTTPAYQTQVLRIVDGDTIIVEIEGKEESVRIIGIDAPEKDECYFEEASENLTEFISNKEITLESKPSENRDDYGRLLRYVFVDETDIGAELIKEGFARNYSWFPHPKRSEYSAFESEAKNNGIGLWKNCDE